MVTTLLLLCVIIVLDLVITSLDVLVLSIVLSLIAYKYKRIRKYDGPLYLVAVLIALIAIFLDLEIISSGLIGFAFYHVVLFTGVLPNQWSITKKLKSYRGLYSILGYILIVPHVWLHLFIDQEIKVFGIAAMVIMLPLFISSFKAVQKAMKSSEWVKLHKAAYVVYLLLFIHLVSVAAWYGKIVYAVLLTLYINNKLLKEWRR